MAWTQLICVHKVIPTTSSSIRWRSRSYCKPKKQENMKKNYIKPSVEAWKVEPSALMQMSMGGEFKGNLGDAHAPSFSDDIFGDNILQDE